MADDSSSSNQQCNHHGIKLMLAKGEPGCPYCEIERLTAELERERKGWSSLQQLSELQAERDRLRHWLRWCECRMVEANASISAELLAVFRVLRAPVETTPAHEWYQSRDGFRCSRCGVWALTEEMKKKHPTCIHATL